MKKIITLFTAVILAGGLQAQVDRSQPPQAAEAAKLHFGEYQTFKLRNGLTVILVENHKLPVVSFSLSLDYDPIREREQSGTASMAGSLLKTGTLNRTKQQIDEEIDFIGGNLSTSSGGIFGSSLKKHQDKLLELMTDVLLNPSFPEAELEKLRKQTISGLQFSSTNAAAISANVSQVLRYGKNHPYGEIVTEETVGNITPEGIRKFYETYFRPNAAYLIMVGDLDLKESKKLAKTWFSSWKKAPVPKMKYENPEPIGGVKVAFVDKPGAVQSVISITHPVYLQPGAPDVIPAMLMNNILGGGVFSGRLMMNLREDKAYTYGATSSLSTDRLVGSFQAGAQVGNSVTDSAITEFFYEIRRMSTEPVSEETLRMNKNIVFGQFARALESPQTVASFALNTFRYNLPKDYYATYLEKLEEVGSSDLLRMAGSYLKPDECYVVVVGNKSEVADKLRVFASGGEVDFYDRYGNPVMPASAVVPENLTPEAVIERYLAISGGREAMEGIGQLTMLATGSLEAMGQEVKLLMTRYQEAPNKVSMKMEMQGMTLSTQVYDGEQGFVKSIQGTQVLTGAELEELKYDSYMFPELFYLEQGYQLKLDGIERIGNKDAVVLVVTNPAGKSQREFYSIESGQKLRVALSRETPQGVMESVVDYSDYQMVDGVMFPFVMVQQVGPQQIRIEVDRYDTKSPVDPAVYKK